MLTSIEHVHGIPRAQSVVVAVIEKKNGTVKWRRRSQLAVNNADRVNDFIFTFTQLIEKDMMIVDICDDRYQFSFNYKQALGTEPNDSLSADYSFLRNFFIKFLDLSQCLK